MDITSDCVVPDSPAPPQVRALVTTRSGGVSSGPYVSLNLGRMRTDGYFEHSVLITRQLKDQRFTPKALAFSVGPQLPDFTKSLGKDADYTMGVAYWHPRMKYKDSAYTIEQYNEMFKRKYGRDPDLFKCLWNSSRAIAGTSPGDCRKPKSREDSRSHA